MATTLHPFDGVRDYEIKLASKLIKDAYPGDADVHFVQIDRLDPPKKTMIKYLEAEKSGSPLPSIPRILYLYYWTHGKVFNKALVNATIGHIVTKGELPEGIVGPMMPEDVEAVEEYCLKHPVILKEIEKLQLPKGYTVRTDPWIYGTDDSNEKRVLIQFYMYVLGGNGHTESNHYSLPLKFSPVFEAFTRELVRIDYLPSGADGKISETAPWQEVPCVEYHPDLNGEAKERENVKPILITQPDGPSFTTEGSKVKWMGWEFRVVPNAREGFAIYDGSFKGRSVFYRLALSEMTVPYGDPRPPYHRKQAFDLGDCGFGINANSLALGCDCLGVIKYLDFTACRANGDPTLRPNVVCMHEQDDGILYKHVNYRTQHSVVARRREFVVQTIATVANYEYAVNIKFVNDGGIDIEVRATGILSTMPIDEGITVPWGTVVGPNVMAAYHQHILSFRIDPAVDGHRNTLEFDDIKRLPVDELNPRGIGYVTEKNFVEKAGAVKQSPESGRIYKIVNENVINKVTQTPVGYKIKMPYSQPLLAEPDSFNVKRAHFATEALWVTQYKDHTLSAAGEFTNQSQKDTGLSQWANGVDNVRNDDIVIWATMGFTHVPRVEDFPVMPVEIHNIELVPNNFFERNPALDLPQSTNQFNKSVLAQTDLSIAQNSCCGGKI